MIRSPFPLGTSEADVPKFTDQELNKLREEIRRGVEESQNIPPDKIYLVSEAIKEQYNRLLANQNRDSELYQKMQNAAQRDLKFYGDLQNRAREEIRNQGFNVPLTYQGKPFVFDQNAPINFPDPQGYIIEQQKQMYLGYQAGQRDLAEEQRRYAAQFLNEPMRPDNEAENLQELRDAYLREVLNIQEGALKPKPSTMQGIGEILKNAYGMPVAGGLGQGTYEGLDREVVMSFWRNQPSVGGDVAAVVQVTDPVCPLCMIPMSAGSIDQMWHCVTCAFEIPFGYIDRFRGSAARKRGEAPEVVINKHRRIDLEE